MKAKFYIAYVLLLGSCKSVSNLNYYDETLNFIDNTSIVNCNKSFDNNSLLENVEYNFQEAEKNYINSSRNIDFDSIINFEDTLSTLKIQSHQITIDYKKVKEDLKSSNRRKINRDCFSKEKTKTSIPIFNKSEDTAIVFSKDQTFTYIRDEFGKWIRNSYTSELIIIR